MGQNFKSAVFNLCKKCEKHPRAQEIRELIYNISVVTTKNEDDIPGRPPHGDFAYISSHHNIQFLGYLITDESVDEYNKQPPFHLTPLDDNERYIIEMGHKTINAFIEACVSEIKELFPNAYILINPYYAYREPVMKTEATPIFAVDELRECVKGFRNSIAYKKLIENDALYALESAPKEHVNALAVLFDKQFKDDYSSVSKETEELLNGIDTDPPTIANLLMIYCLYCYALQKALTNAVQLLYEALLGQKFIVFNNDNIINIDNKGRNLVYERYTVLSQDVLFGTGIRPDVGSIVLLSCDMSEGHHIKEFGCVYSVTLSISDEFGSSIRVSFVTIDDDLNPIHIVTDRVMNTNLGKMHVNYNRK